MASTIAGTSLTPMLWTARQTVCLSHSKRGINIILPNLFQIDNFRKVFGKTIKTTEHGCSSMAPIIGMEGDPCADKHNKCFSHKSVEIDGINHKNMHVCCCSEEK